MTSSIQRSVAARRANAHHMAESMRALDAEVAGKLAQCGRIPEAWHEIARRRDEPRHERVTIALEEDVLRFWGATTPAASTRCCGRICTPAWRGC